MDTVHTQYSICTKLELGNTLKIFTALQCMLYGPLLAVKRLLKISTSGNGANLLKRGVPVIYVFLFTNIIYK